MDRREDNVFWFVYYRHVQYISMDELEHGLVWKRIPEFPYGFSSRKEAIDWLEFLAEDKLELEPYEGEYVFRFAKYPAYYYTFFSSGIAYLESPPEPGSPWNVGVLREMAGFPRPASIHTPRTKIRVAIPASSATGGEIIAEF